MVYKDPNVFTSEDSSGDIDLAEFPMAMMNGLLHYINQIFLIEKPDISDICKKMNVSPSTLYRIRNCQIEDTQYVNQVLQLAIILGVKGTVTFNLQR